MNNENGKDLVSSPGTELYSLDQAYMNLASLDRMDTMMKVCSRLSKMPALPKRYRGSPDRCFMALDLSLRLGEPFMVVAQQMSEVYGMPAMSAKWQNGRLVKSGFLKSGPTHVWTGRDKRETASCYVSGIRASDGQELRGAACSWQQAVQVGWTDRRNDEGKNISLWPGFWELMIHYRALTNFISQFAFHVTGGVLETHAAMDIGPEPAMARSPYASDTPDDPARDAEDADWHDVPEDAEPSPESVQKNVKGMAGMELE